MSRDDEHPELPPVPAGDARVVVEVGHLELAAPGVGRRRPEVVRDAGHLQRRQRPRRAELQLHDVVVVAADHVDPLEHLAERDGEEATGGRGGAAAAERP